MVHVCVCVCVCVCVSTCVVWCAQNLQRSALSESSFWSSVLSGDTARLQLSYVNKYTFVNLFQQAKVAWVVKAFTDAPSFLFPLMQGRVCVCVQPMRTPMLTIKMLLNRGFSHTLRASQNVNSSFRERSESRPDSRRASGSDLTLRFAYDLFRTAPIETRNSSRS